MRSVLLLAAALAMGVIALPIAIEKRVLVTEFDFEIKTVTVFVTAGPLQPSINSTSMASTSSPSPSSLASSSSSSTTTTTTSLESNRTEPTTSLNSFNIESATTESTTSLESTTTELPTPEPTPTESTTSEPTISQPTLTESTSSEPTATQSTTAEPTTTESTTAEPTTIESTTTESITAESITTEPTIIESTTTGPTTIESTTTASTLAASNTTASNTTKSTTTKPATTKSIAAKSATTAATTTPIATTAAAVAKTTAAVAKATTSPRRLRPSRRPNPNVKPSSSSVRVRFSTPSTKTPVAIPTRVPFTSGGLSTFLTKIPPSTPALGPSLNTESNPLVSSEALAPVPAPVFNEVHRTGEIQATLSSGPDFQAAVLYHHNVARANHGAPPLVWDAACEAGARRAAQTCVFEHPKFLKDLHQGQNIFAVSGDVFNVTAGITESWYKAELAPMEPYWGAKNIPPDVFGKVGHLTAMLWKGTAKVGCVAQDCGDRMKLKDGTPTGMNKFFVCNYAEPGNYAGEYADNVQPPIDPSILGSWAD